MATFQHNVQLDKQFTDQITQAQFDDLADEILEFIRVKQAELGFTDDTEARFGIYPPPRRPK